MSDICKNSLEKIYKNNNERQNPILYLREYIN